MNDSKVINKLENLKKLRESKNITQVKLANYFNCSVDYLLGITDIPTPVNYLVNPNKNNAEILNKYNSLSNEDKKYFDKFLTFLVDNSNKDKK